MALPTAPLGQLPSMNMPYSVPTYDVGPSIWEKALAAFLVNAAGGAAQKGVSNVMSQDYAKEFGEKPSSGFGRLLGPRVGEEDAIRRRTAASQKEAQMREIAADANTTRFNATQALNRQAQGLEADILREQMANDRLDTELASRSDLTDRQMALDTRRDIALAQLRAELEARDPNRRAQAEADRARAREANAQASLYERFRDRGQGGQAAPEAAPQVAPEVLQDVEMDQGTMGLNDYMSSFPGQARTMSTGIPGVPVAPSTPAPSPITSAGSPEELALSELIAQATGAPPTPGQIDLEMLQAMQELLRRGIGDNEGAIWNAKPTKPLYGR